MTALALVLALAMTTGAFARTAGEDAPDCALINAGPTSAAPMSFGAKMAKARAAKKTGAPKVKKVRVKKTKLAKAPKAPAEPKMDGIGN